MLTDMDAIRELIGREQDLEHVTRQLRFFVEELRAPVVGALHVTCSDESEHECIETFQRGFVDTLLPQLKLWSQSPFRSSNLGGRYEWGAVRVAEQHYATPESREGAKAILVKVNSHVSVAQTGTEVQYGPMERYQTESHACGALHALLENERWPFTDELRELFSDKAIDRIAILRDPERVDPRYRYLLAAVLCARLHARRAVLDVQDYRPTTPTFYLIVPCVTLNRPERDTEIVCGVYYADYRTEQASVEYCGLGDEPDKYQVAYDCGTLVITDAQIHAPRPASDYRKLLLQEARKHLDRRGVKAKVQGDERVQSIVAEAQAARHHDPAYARLMLKALLPLLAELTPVTAALALFGYGLADIHHIYRVHRLARQVTGHEEARRILDDIHARVDRLPPEQARSVIDLLLAQHGH
jgi:hypothetical protein